MQSVLKVSGRCLEGVWKVSGRCLKGWPTIFSVKIFSGPKFVKPKFIRQKLFGSQIFRVPKQFGPVFILSKNYLKP